ncbi:MAG: cobalamin-binding protein [Bryobacteraceae bacterium]
MELRLLPLISSATEMVHALGLGRFQVGRSHECDYPPEVSHLPVCTWPNIAVNGSSAEIDRLVKERAAAAASIYEVDTQLIRELRPTHIFTQMQCKVCAVSLDDVERAMRAGLGTDVRVVSLEPYALDDLWRDIRRVAKACGHAADGESLVAVLKQKMAVIAGRAASARTRPRVAALEWIEPLMAAGNWVPELIEMAGGANLFGVAGEHAPWMTWEQLVAADPDAIVALPCGFGLERSANDARLLANRPGWKDLKAVRAGSVYACDGNQFLNRPGPRLVESLQILAEILHPEIFEPQWEKSGWVRIYRDAGKQVDRRDGDCGGRVLGG